jgi:uncharacterized protein YkwD
MAMTPSPPVAGAATCANADLVPTPGNLPQVRHATQCLINRQRRVHGLRKLVRRRSLMHVAQAHTTDMVGRRYFSHLTPAGLTVEARIRRTPYGAARTQLRAGENIAWGLGALATPRAVMAQWMASAAHRANILSGAYRHIGVGTSVGSPHFGVSGATFTVVFAARS